MTLFLLMKLFTYKIHYIFRQNENNMCFIDKLAFFWGFLRTRGDVHNAPMHIMQP
jgi:hypothetical protein